MTTVNFAKVLGQAAALLEGAEDMLCAIDGETGDGDHGVTVAKIARAIMTECETGSADTPAELLGDISMAIMALNGGSAGPLWAMMFDGMSESIDGAEELCAESVAVLIEGAHEGLSTISDAVEGMKTMVDALVPAAKAARAALESGADTESVLSAASVAAQQGAEATKDMLAHYGRAKNLKEDSLGHMDPGAVGVATMIKDIYTAYVENK